MTFEELARLTGDPVRVVEVDYRDSTDYPRLQGLQPEHRDPEDVEARLWP